MHVAIMKNNVQELLHSTYYTYWWRDAMHALHILLIFTVSKTLICIECTYRYVILKNVKQ